MKREERKATNLREMQRGKKNKGRKNRKIGWIKEKRMKEEK